MEINRPVHTQDSFDGLFKRPEDDSSKPRNPLKESCGQKCSTSKLKEAARAKLPFIGIMKNYQLRKWLLNDVISGLSIAVIHIPQGMGFALLTSLPPVYGLYSSFFPVILYFFFGTSRHISLGTMAVVSLMIGAIVDQQATQEGFLPEENILNNVNETFNTTRNQSDTGQSDYIHFKVDIAVSVTLLMGMWQIVMSMINLGVVATFMSMAFIGGFLTGSAFHIATSQIPSMFGVKIAGHNGMFRLPIIWYQIAMALTETNYLAVIISVVSIILLFTLKEIVNVKFKDKLKAPIPAELIVVVVGTLISYFANINQDYGVNIVGEIPIGLPPPRVPSMYNAGQYMVDSIIIGIVSFAISVSMAKMFSRKHGYSIDQNQEMFASGVAHFVSSFFHCFGGAQAPPRSLVQEGTGGQTQVAGLVSSLIVLLVCLVMGPLFQPLPNAVLAAIIIIALLPLFKSFGDLRNMWNVNKIDCLTWLITWSSTTFVGITFGIITGIAFSMISVVMQAYFVKGSWLTGVQGEIYRNKDTYTDSKDNGNIKIFKFESPLFFANVDNFKSQLYANIDLTKADFVEQQKSLELDVVNQNDSSNHDAEKACGHDMDGKDENQEVPLVNSHQHVQKIIIDCSAITYIDSQGLKMLKMIKSDLNKFNVRLLLCNCSDLLLSKLESVNYCTGENEISLTIHDAVVAMS